MQHGCLMKFKMVTEKCLVILWCLLNCTCLIPRKPNTLVKLPVSFLRFSNHVFNSAAGFKPSFECKHSLRTFSIIKSCLCDRVLVWCLKFLCKRFPDAQVSAVAGTWFFCNRLLSKISVTILSYFRTNNSEANSISLALSKAKLPSSAALPQTLNNPSLEHTLSDLSLFTSIGEKPASIWATPFSVMQTALQFCHTRTFHLSTELLPLGWKGPSVPASLKHCRMHPSVINLSLTIHAAPSPLPMGIKALHCNNALCC